MQLTHKQQAPQQRSKRSPLVALAIVIGLIPVAFLGIMFAMLVQIGDSEEDLGPDEGAYAYSVPAENVVITECGVDADGFGQASFVATDIPSTGSDFAEIRILFVDPDGVRIGRGYAHVSLPAQGEPVEAEIGRVEFEEGSTFDGCEVS